MVATLLSSLTASQTAKHSFGSLIRLRNSILRRPTEGTHMSIARAIEPGLDFSGAALSSKIQPHHLERLSVVYIRQSSLQQVANNSESTKLQYGLPRRAEQLGWSSQGVILIDDDLGRSGTSAEGRPGFQRLVAEVGLNHLGIIIGIEMSRLARSCKDWHQLLEICALFGTLIADLDGVYDPSDYNDRLLLGLKGTLKA
jgi:hypothetical protein